MAKIRKIYDETIKPDGNKTVIYPITSTRAVYTPTNVTLDNILNEGYRFGGVVSPSSVPTIYDQRVFYGASEPGVYSAFGGIIVETGEAAFLMYDGSIWTKKLFSKTGSNITGFKVVDSISDLPTTPSTLGYLIPDSNSVQTLYVWVGEGGDTYGGMYNNCGRLNGESAYETAVRNGYQGTEQEWLLSLNGQDGRGIVNVSYQQDIETRNTIVTFLFSDGTTSSFPLQDGLSKDQIDANTEAIAAADSNIETLSTATSANTTSIIGLSKLASINVILDPTQSFASQVTEPSVVYEIRDDFDLGGAEITLPDDCVLLFNGGKIANGTVNAANATYQVMGLYQIFDGIEFGNNFFKCCDIIPEYVGAVGDGVADDTEAMRESLKISSLGRTTLVIPSGRGYLVSGPINYYNGGFANSFINIKGFLPDMKTTDTDINSILNYGRIIVADGACLFGDATRTNLSTLRGAISNVAILGTRNLDTNFFKWCNVVSFCMKYCFVCDFGAFLCDSSLKTNSRVHDNHFASVFYFSRLVNRDLISLIDSAIFNNYINGGANPKEIVTVNACFQFGEYNGSVIRDNFIDFYRTIYEPVRTSNSGPAGHINAFGNHYQVFRYFYFMGSGITSMYMNSQHEYFNWNDEAVIGSPDGPLGNNYMPFVSRTYTGRDGNTYNLPPYIMRTTGGAQNIVIEDITVERNMDKLIMFHGAPTSYKYNRYKFTVANWTDDFGTKYSLPEGSDEGNYCGGSFQYKEVETNFICTLSELPTLKVGTYSAFPYGAKALYNGTIYKAKRFYTTAAVARWVPYNDVAFFPDYEDFTANSNMQLKLRDRDTSNGMGYKILRTDKTFAAQVTSTDTVYEIRYNFDLDSSTVTLPENAVLKFVGGKISNGTLNGNKTKIDAGKYDTIFDSVILSGTFDCDYLTPVQFGAVMDNAASADTNSSIISNYVKPSCEGTSTPLYIPVGSLYFSSPIVLSGNVDITCKGTLVYNGSASTAVALTIGTSQNQYNRNYVIRLSNANDSNNYYSQVSDEWQIQDVTGLLMKNIHSSRIHLEYIKGFPYNVVLSGENAPFAYNTIYCGYNTGYTYINMKLICSGSGYSNENLFIGGRFGITSTCSVRDISKAIVLDGDTNVINNNVFIKPCIEGHNIGFEFSDATRNTILASRNENNTYNNAFLSNSRENVVLSGYYEGAVLNKSNGSNLSSSFAALLNSYMATVANDPVIVYGNNSNLIQLLNNRTISGNAARSLYGRGYVIDVSVFKTWRISQDVLSRFAIVPLNSDNSPITVSNVTDFITNTSGWIIQNSYIRSSADAYSRMVTFSSNTSKVFIGTTATTEANRLRLETMYNPYTTVSSLIPFPELAKWPYDVKSVNSIPSTQRNVPTGYSIYYNNRLVVWNGSSWKDTSPSHQILNAGSSVESQLVSSNTIYEVRDAFDLGGTTITVPSGCSIIFEGGKFTNGSLVGDNTKLQLSNNCFTGITVSGTWNVPYINVKAFSDIEDENVLRQAFALCNESAHNIVEMESDLTCLVSVAADEGVALSIPANTEFILNGTIQLKANAFPGYRIVDIRKSNITIRGNGKIWGDFTKGHEYPEISGRSTHEWGRGISIRGGVNVLIDGIEVGYCTGDAFVVARYNESSEISSKNIILRNIYGHTSRRQGLTVANCDGMFVENYIFDNISGTDPQAGIDVEPNSGNAGRLIFNNGIISNCKLGVSIVQPMTSGQYQNISFTNLHLDSISQLGIIVENNGDTLGASCTIKGLSYKNASAIAPLVRVQNGGLIIDGMQDMGMDDEDTAYPCALFYTNRATAMLSVRNAKTRCGVIAAARHGRLDIQDSYFVLAGKLGSAYDSIGDSSTVTISNSTITGDKVCNFKGQSYSIENCLLELSYMTFECTANSTRNCLFSLKGCHINTSGRAADGVAIVTSATGKSYTEIIGNVINHAGIDGFSSYLVVPNSDNDFVTFENNDVTAPNTTSLFGPAAAVTRWNCRSKGLNHGTTSNRPILSTNSTIWQNHDVGYQYYDTTIGKPIWWAGTKWVYADGSDA